MNWPKEKKTEKFFKELFESDKAKKDKYVKKKLIEYFGDVTAIDDNGRTVLHYISEYSYKGYYFLRASKCLIDMGANPNAKDDDGNLFISQAIKQSYRLNVILDIIQHIVGTSHFDFNAQDEHGNTFMHWLIMMLDPEIDLEIDYTNFLELYEYSVSEGFNPLIRNKEGETVFDTFLRMSEEKDFSKEQILLFANTFSKHLKSKQVEVSSKIEMDANSSIMDKRDREYLSKYGSFLTEKEFHSRPVIDRDNELKELIVTLADNEKTAMIVGPSGVGKTAIARELAYRIQNGEVPEFLKNAMVFELNKVAIASGIKYIGTFEERINKFMNICLRYPIILFIDEIQGCVGLGRAEGQVQDLMSMLQEYIDRDNLKVIGTTTSLQYEDFIASMPIKRRFERISVKEPPYEIVRRIAKKSIQDNSQKYEIRINENLDIERILDIILYMTDTKNRVYNDRENDPALTLSVIGKSFAHARARDSKTVDMEDFVYGVAHAERIYPNARTIALECLRELSISIQKDTDSDPAPKIIDFKQVKGGQY